MDDKGPDTLYGLRAAARHVGMSFRQAKHRAAKGEMPTFKMGRTVCASRAVLDAWLTALANGHQNATPAKLPSTIPLLDR